ncbi:hypothetical protein AVEN_240439-1 [Araneus ventricosus]|uniref:Uncharacterized protein n=1 Tax=Araneus ventricosus TaxID=182803 RepID=A0A4Y2MI90_ARAVE|nr:hypothetical protein AVEN_240439-1 [Araneus ventricosus]
MEESESEDFGPFQKEMEAAGMKEVIYLESFMVNFSTSLFVLINKLGSARMKAHYSYVCGIQEVGDGGEYDMTGLRTTNLTKPKFVSVVNGQFAIYQSHLKAILPDCIFQVDCQKELSDFLVVPMSKKHL